MSENNYIDKLKIKFEGKTQREKLTILFELGHDIEYIIENLSDLIYTFDDLVFRKHPNTFIGGISGYIEFENKHFVSVVGGGRGIYGDGVKTFEIGFGLPDGNIDVIGHLSPKEITEEMIKIQMKEPY